jgi:hypothetical protein
MYSLGKAVAPEKMILTFENLLQNTDFVKLMKAILQKLERHYERPVDIEFAVKLIPEYPTPSFKISLLQCRPLSNQEWDDTIEMPANVPPENRIFTANHLVPQGVVEKIKYIIYVDPLVYGQIADTSVRLEIARVIGRLNKILGKEVFILMGPGRWGSSNIDLGVKVSYADIYNTRILIEIAVARNGVTPEVSYGTHFFQDLVESKIYPLPLFPDNEGIVFNKQFIDKAVNQLPTLSPRDRALANYVKVINVSQVYPGKLLRVVMSAEESQALAYLHRY